MSATEDSSEESAARCALFLGMTGTAIIAGYTAHHRVDMLSATGPCRLPALAALHCSTHAHSFVEGVSERQLYPLGYVSRADYLPGILPDHRR